MQTFILFDDMYKNFGMELGYEDNVDIVHYPKIKL